MSDRTHGATKDCRGCRHWSEMLAQSRGGGNLEAMCLAENGPYSNKYVIGRQSCVKWQSGHFGATDDPPDYGESVRAAYAEEEAPHA